jgi:hypothetical protein
MKPRLTYRLPLILILLCPAFVEAASPRLSLEFSNEYQWRRISGTAEAARVYHIQSSSNLVAWKTIATLLDSGSLAATNTPFHFLDPASGSSQQRFYRSLVQMPAATNDWKNQIAFPFDGFAATNVSFGQPRWIKFLIPLADPVRVFYQDSRAYLFHYDFASTRLDPFRGLTRQAFDAASLHTNGQQLVLGAILYPPDPLRREIGIQFVGLDPYPREAVAAWFKLVKSTIVNLPETVLYIPTIEQLSVAEANREYFASNGVAVSSVDAWLGEGDQVYSPGWALGRLKFFPASEIRAAFNDGRLRSEDILLTDGVPAEIPILAGLITLAPATPNAHVAILARSYGIPFVYLTDPAERARVQGLVGREIVLRARAGTSIDPVKIADVEGELTEALRAELLALKAPVQIDITPKSAYGAFSASTTNLTPADIRYFGGKAANYGLLRRTVPTNSPEAIAFSFDLWDAFLDQTLPDGRTLRTNIHERLASYTFPPHLPSLITNLAAIRNLIRFTARFSPAQQQTITNALRPFGASRNIRFRSSTNVEDADNFVGAGLYDSFSGCLADDLDGDTTGPSACDPTEDEERGVFRAIQRVYASFYNDDAFIERLRLGVNEAQVGMALLVHHSFPDDIEMANGVATVEVQRSGTNMSLSAYLNTQIGANSVTNPDGTSQPEVVRIHRFLSGSTSLSFEQGSSLIPRGAYVMNWESDYRALMELLAKVCDGYLKLYTNRTRFNLDFEYKKVQPDGRLELKQVREIPAPAPQGIPAAYLIGTSELYETWQGECGSHFGVHRLKSTLQVQTHSTRLDGTNATFFGQTTFQYLDGANVATLTGPLSTFSNHLHSVNSSDALDSWTVNSGTNRFDLTVVTSGAAPSPKSSIDPIVFLSDFWMVLRVRYRQPVFDLTSQGATILITNDQVCLQPRRAVRPDDPPRSSQFTGTNGFSITADYWTPLLAHFAIIKTIPLLAWNQTRITGLTTQPLVLTNYFSQTFRPGHHNFVDDYIFEPRLDPNVTAQQLSELSARNIKLLYLHDAPIATNRTVWALGFDDSVRELK